MITAWHGRGQKRMKGLSDALKKAGINNIYYKSKGIVHEWLTPGERTFVNLYPCSLTNRPYLQMMVDFFIDELQKTHIPRKSH